MFNSNFYPTPPAVIETMTAGLEIHGKHILEPSAGSGNIVDFLIEAGSIVSACENHVELIKIVAAKCQIIKPDFLTLEKTDVSHFDFIIMNPPFSNQNDHILHAWEIAPAGCQIVSLFNHDSMRRMNTTKNRQINDLIKDNGYQEFLGNVFSTAERITDIDIGMLRIFKPAADGENFDQYFDLEDKYQEFNTDGIVRYDEIQDIVSRFVGALKIFDETVAANNKMEDIIRPIGSFSGIHFGAVKTDHNGYVQHVDKDMFRISLQKSAWQIVFDKFNIRKYVTSSINEELNRFIEKQKSFPFTMNNIYKMIEMIIGTTQGRFDKVLIQAFDKICSFSASNSGAGEKWKTNSNYKVNRKFIVDYMCDYEAWRSDSRHVKVRYDANDSMDDIIKALCYLTGTNYDQTLQLRALEDVAEWGQWNNWEFFRVKGFKKGTMHFEFLDEKVWELFNLRVGKLKGWQIPQKTDYKRKGTERTRSTEMQLF